ncbi:MAG: tetratricopeptide repeat protein, partial [Candidatus Micrarchaeota archaeon]|nr:tetratricopeptide repeat protein [Candidatus Micrarchaeota archaeon]
AMAYHNLGRAYSKMGKIVGAKADSAKATECYLTAIEKYKHEIALFTEEKVMEKRKVPLSPAQKAWLAGAREIRYSQLARVYWDLAKAYHQQGKKDEEKTAKKDARKCWDEAGKCEKYAGKLEKGKKH